MAKAPHFYTALEDIAKQDGLTKHEIKFDADSDITGGYVCTISEAQIITDTKTIHLIIKSYRANDSIRKIFPMEVIFKKEIYMYEVIFPLFQQIEIDHGISPCQFAPKLYKAYMNNEADALILENLNEAGYSLHDRKNQMDENHIKLPIEQYARLHAISLAFQDQDPSKFKSVTENMDDKFVEWIERLGFIETFIEQMKKASTSLDSNMDTAAINTFETFISNTKSYLNAMPKFVDKYCVILHGDCWKNNMLFQYSDEDAPSTPTDIRFIDFQASRKGSPMLDFTNFFYAAASKNVMDDVNHYLKMYHDSLSNHLLNLGSNSDRVYPFYIMMEHFKQFAPLGLIIRLSAIMVLLSDEEQRKSIPDILEMGGNIKDIYEYNVSDFSTFQDLNRHSIIHFVKNKLI